MTAQAERSNVLWSIDRAAWIYRGVIHQAGGCVKDRRPWHHRGGEDGALKVGFSRQCRVKIGRVVPTYLRVLTKGGTEYLYAYQQITHGDVAAFLGVNSMPIPGTPRHRKSSSSSPARAWRSPAIN